MVVTNSKDTHALGTWQTDRFQIVAAAADSLRTCDALPRPAAAVGWSKIPN
jgi:hypothetical protein